MDPLPRNLPQDAGEALRREASDVRKASRGRKKPQNPLRIAADEWTRAISQVDRHASTCEACNTKIRPHQLAVTLGALTEPALDAYQLCRVAERLYAAERRSLQAYRGLGGPLPVTR